MEDFIRRYYMDDTSHCDAVIEWFESDEIKKLQEPGTTESGDGLTSSIDVAVKESTDVCLSFDETRAHPALHTPLNYLWNSVLQYSRDFDILFERKPFKIKPRINIQKYTPPSGGFKEWHDERGTSDNVFLVWMIYLNDVKKGGGTSFKYLNHTEKAEKGKCILWPADFTHVHKGEIAPEETKYIMTGWYQYK